MPPLLFVITILIAQHLPNNIAVEITSVANNNMESAFTQLRYVICSIKTNYIKVYLGNASDSDCDEFSENIIRLLHENCNGAPIQLEIFTTDTKAYRKYVSMIEMCQ